MTATDRAPRPGDPGEQTALTVAVTGAGNPLGAALARRLTGHAGVSGVVAIDEAPTDLPGVTWQVADVRDPALATRLAGVDVLVHVAYDIRVETVPAERRALNVRGTSVVLDAAAATGVRRIVLVTSTRVYGGQPRPASERPVPFDDEAPVRAPAEDSLLGDFVEIERLAQEAARSSSSPDITILRPATLVGPGVDTVVTRHFEAPRLLVLRGCEPLWQFCHAADLVRALEYAAVGTVTGTVNVASPGWLSQDELERATGLRRLELPPAVAIATAERLQRLGLAPASAGQLEYLLHSTVVTTDRLTAAGWAPAYDNIAALHALLEEAATHTAVGTRRLDRRDATRAAASATVAVVGTAAMVRRARQRRR